MLAATHYSCSGCGQVVHLSRQGDHEARCELLQLEQLRQELDDLVDRGLLGRTGDRYMPAAPVDTSVVSS